VRDLDPRPVVQGWREVRIGSRPAVGMRGGIRMEYVGMTCQRSDVFVDGMVSELLSCSRFSRFG
jgi:hypothetical protein